MENNLRAVILCGGSGSRLWPESRQSLPKQFMPIFEGKSLLDLTIERLLKLNLKTKPIFICNKKHAFIIKETINRYNIDADILLEPVSKNTTAAIYLSAKHCNQNEYLLIMPSDHLIQNIKKFSEDILTIKKNLIPNAWVTLGIKPTKPSSAYGYILVDQTKNNQLNRVIKFTEKPNQKIASQFVKNENYFWNAGIFVAQSSTILKSIHKYAPQIAKTCDKIYNESKINKNKNEFNFSLLLFSKLPSCSIDYAVMEHEKNIYLFPLNTTWSDVGSWDSIAEIYESKRSNEKVIQLESKNNFILSKKRVVATIGVKDLIIVDSDDATLICKKNHSEKVREIVDTLVEKNSVEANEHVFEYRPWGKFENLFEDKNCKVKRIIINPKKRISLQYHNYRSEHWLIVSGEANVKLNDINLVLSKGQSIDIPAKSHHFLENKTESSLIVIETQLGSYFGEDDIIRIDDPYDR